MAAVTKRSYGDSTNTSVPIEISGQNAPDKAQNSLTSQSEDLGPLSLRFSPLYTPPPTALERERPRNPTEIESAASSLIPSWVEKFHFKQSPTTLTIFLKPIPNTVSSRDVDATLRAIQDAVFPFGVRFILPTGAPGVDGKPLPSAYSFIKSRNTNEAGNELKVGTRTFTQEEIRRDIDATLPAGAEAFDTKFYLIDLATARINFVVVNYFGDADSKELATWRSEFQRRHGVSTFLNKSKTSSGIDVRLSALTDETGLIRPERANDLALIFDSFFPSPPPAPERRTTLKNPRKDHTKTEYIALDAASTRDREDLIYARRLRNGNILLKVAYIDITDLVPLNSDLDRYAKRLGRTLYGAGRSIPTLGEEIAHGPANFALGETRPAWEVTMVVDGRTGEILRRHRRAVTRATVKAHRYLTPEQFVGSLSSSESESNLSEHALADAGRLLRMNRVRTNTLIRLDGDSLASEVLAEIMIAAKGKIGEFMDAENLNAFWRVLTPTSEPRLQTLADDIVRATTTRYSPQELNLPDYFVSIMSMLQDIGSHTTTALVRRYLGITLKRSEISTVNQGHAAVAQPYYIEIKPRDSSGIWNSQILDAFFEGNEGPSLEELQNQATWINERRANEGEKRYNFNFLEALLRRLSQASRSREVTITKVGESDVAVAITGSKMRAYIPRSRFTGDIQPVVGQRLYARLEGYNPARKSYEFSPRLSPMPALPPLGTLQNRTHPVETVLLELVSPESFEDDFCDFGSDETDEFAQ